MYFCGCLRSMISIHALREEGDLLDAVDELCLLVISIHALREEGDTTMPAQKKYTNKDFYPRPPRGGRPLISTSRKKATADFYPRPPRGGRLTRLICCRKCERYFYPRPPRGGRRKKGDKIMLDKLFLSTPSARRATLPCGCPQTRGLYFYPRPPRGGRRAAQI